jgi:hypothetical protein
MLKSFCKYVNTYYPIPLVREVDLERHSDEKQGNCQDDSQVNNTNLIGEFMCFLQHLQWNMTCGMMYTSDFQGENSFLHR